MNDRGEKNIYAEIGTSGLPVMAGYVQAAYNADMRMPAAYNEFERIRRSDPEVVMVGRGFSALAGQQQIIVQPPERPNDAEKRATEFLAQALEEVEGGMESFKQTLIGYVPFYGWGWWEVPLGVRSPKFKSNDGWSSRHNDNLVAPRALAFRHPSSFYRWQIDDYTKRVRGFEQQDTPNPMVVIPLERSVHITLGDAVNPEGMSPLEALYRLERYKYSLEIILGIGFEHAAGHVKFSIKDQLDAEAKSLLSNAARAILSAVEGNYITEIMGKFEANVIDVPFAASTSLLEAIRYYGLLKLQVFNMQWIAIATTAGTGAYSAAADASEMGVMAYNGMTESAIWQMNRQLVARLFDHPVNAAAFAGMVNRPRIIITPVQKSIALNELSQFVSQISPIVPMSPADIAAIRRKSGFLPEMDEADEAMVDNPGTENDDVPAHPPTPTPASSESAGTPQPAAEMALPQHLYSPVDTALEAKQYDTLARLIENGLVAQYQGEQVNKLIRQRALTDAELLELAHQLTPPMADEETGQEWLLLLLFFAGIGRDLGKRSAGTLTLAQMISSEKSIADAVGKRLLDLLDDNGKLSLTETSIEEIVNLIRQAERLAEAAGNESLANIMQIYEELADDAIGSRTETIAVTETAAAVNAGTRAIGDATGATTKTWLRTRSKSPRQKHLDQVGVTVGYNDRFPDGSDWAGELPNCKCGVLLGYE